MLAILFAFAQSCSRLLVATDPYQWETVDEVWLVREVERLEIRARWHALSDDDAETLALMRRELNARAAREEIIRGN